MNRSSVNLHSAQSHAVLRSWQARGTGNHVASDFVLPIFVIPEDDKTEPIPSLPGVSRLGKNATIDFLRPLIEQLDLTSVLLFPVVSEKGLEKAVDSAANPLLRLIPQLKQQFPSLLINVDVCLCGFSETGHCCVFHPDGKMDNERSVQELASIALAYAKAGAHVIAPSDMMDGRIGGIRRALDLHNFQDVAIMSYAAKFSSCFYGPFRDAAGSAPQFGDRKNYQLPPGARGLALRAVERDVAEGADLVMVKPGLPYLDIVREVANEFPRLSIAVYHVSGEYAMLAHGAKAGAFELKSAVLEVIGSFKRAGATVIITYFTPQLLQWLKE